MRESINLKKEYGAMLLAVVSMLSFGSQSVSAQSQEFSDHFALIRLDKTDYYLGNYGAIITNLDTGEQILNVYTDDGSRYIEIPGYIEVDSGQTLEACAVTLEFGEIVCDTQVSYGDETEFYLDMAYREPIQDIPGYADKFQGDLTSDQDFNDDIYLDTYY